MQAKEAKMRPTISIQRELPLPRGWIILGLALAGWAVVTGLWISLTPVFAFVLAAI